MICDKRKISNKGKFDVVVVGGGIAGIAAAVAAARNGMKTLLIEKLINLGGLATSGLISWYEPLCNGKGNKITGITAEELIKLAVKYSYDTLSKKWGGDEKNRVINERYSTFFSPSVFSVALDEFVLNSGVVISFDTYAVYPVVENNCCTGVICETAGSKEYFEAKAVIDATGNAVICERAGIPTVIGKNYMTYISHIIDKEGIKEFSVQEDFSKLRKWKNVGSDLLGNGHPEGLRLLDGVTAENITDYVIYGKKELLKWIKTKDKNSYDIMSLPQMPQFRTIRRIEGKSDFNAHDGEQFFDSIGKCSDFRMNRLGNCYSIPYSAMYNEKITNIITAGRIISSPQGDGWEVARVIPTCALTGEAAGNAAYLMVHDNCTNDEVNIKKLQSLQEKNNILI